MQLSICCFTLQHYFLIDYCNMAVSPIKGINKEIAYFKKIRNILKSIWKHPFSSFHVTFLSMLEFVQFLERDEGVSLMIWQRSRERISTYTIY